VTQRILVTLGDLAEITREHKKRWAHVAQELATIVRPTRPEPTDWDRVLRAIVDDWARARPPQAQAQRDEAHPGA
jgi:hypothetical protein